MEGQDDQIQIHGIDILKYQHQDQHDDQHIQVELVDQMKEGEEEMKDSQVHQTINLATPKEPQKSNLHFSQIEQYLEKQFDGDFSDDQISVQEEASRLNSQTNDQLMRHQPDLMGELGEWVDQSAQVIDHDADFADDNDQQPSRPSLPTTLQSKEFKFDEKQFNERMKRNKIKGQQMFQSNLKGKLSQIKNEKKEETKVKQVQPKIEEAKEREKEDKESEDEWKGVNQATLAHIEQKASQGLEIAQEWEQVSWRSVYQQMKNSPCLDQLESTTRKDLKPSLLQRILGCLQGQSTQLLLDHKAHLLALSQIKTLPEPQLHSLLSQLYMHLTQESVPPARIGSHWESIGFQNVDPMTDTRGGGVLALLNILYFTEQHPTYCHRILDYSHHQSNKFPLAATLINVTTFLLSLLQGHKLDKMLKKDQQQAVQTFLQLFCISAMQLLDEYRTSGSTVRDMGILIQNTSDSLPSRLPALLQEYLHDMQ